MFELTLSTTSDKNNYISKLYDLVKQEAVKLKGIVVKQMYNKRSFFTLAVPDKHKDYFKAKIIDYIVFMISDDYKFNFYKQNLNLNQNSFLCESFVKAISIFDNELDREIIKNSIEFSNEILVDSFFYFKLSSLKQRWQKTAEVINENGILQNKSLIIEIIKYLTVSADCNSYQTDVHFNKNQIKLKSMGKSKSFKRDFFGSSNFFSEIVEINPVKINIISKNNIENDEIFKTLMEIYPEKICVTNC